MLIERLASTVASSCGVVTTMKPSMSRACIIDSGASDVPGGRSMSRKSRSPQLVDWRNWLSALWIIGPRQMIASSSFCWKKPMDMTLTLKRSAGIIFWSGPITGGSAIFIARTTLGQSMSASRIPTRAPSYASVAARLTVTVVLPTPPLPL